MITVNTIGHSNRPQHEFLLLLQELEVKALVDVRAVPRSGRYLQFNADSLREACGQASITYHWAGRQLGGMRAPAADSPNTLLEGGLRGYADHMNSPVFRTGINQLVNLATGVTVAIMCAERCFRNCHRALIADYLTIRGVTVMHIMTKGDVRRHSLRPEARQAAQGIVYDRGVQGTLDV